MHKSPYLLFILIVCNFASSPRANATETLCDVSYQNCRTPLLALIQNEKIEIDVAYWFMDDQNLASALIKRKQAGVKIRILMDTRADDPHPSDAMVLGEFVSAGIPMRERVVNGILHWKTMIFAGQGMVEFSGANFTGSELVPVTPYVNYADEAIYFCDDPALVNSFKTKYDDSWTDTVNFAGYANITTPPARAYPTYAIDPELNFPPGTWQQNFGTRAIAAINAEKVKLDVDIFRITASNITTATINAFKRGVQVRMLIDKSEYRNPARPWDAYNVDLLYMAGVPMKINIHKGQNHEKMMLLYGQGLTIFGSSNWTTPSFNIQQEHNYFTTKAWFFQWFQNSFSRKWNSGTEYAVFAPLPPGAPVIGAPVIKVPANGALEPGHQFDLEMGGRPLGPEIRHLLWHDFESSAAGERRSHGSAGGSQRATDSGDVQCFWFGTCKKIFLADSEQDCGKPDNWRPNLVVHYSVERVIHANQHVPSDEPQELLELVHSLCNPRSVDE